MLLLFHLLLSESTFGVSLVIFNIIIFILDPLCEIDGEEVVYVNVGSSHSINCSVSSPDPPHHVFWYFNQEVIKDLRPSAGLPNVINHNIL